MSPSWPVTQRGTFDIFLHECTHFLSVRIPFACGQIFLNLQKKMLMSMMEHFSFSKHFSVSHNDERVNDERVNVVSAVASHDEAYHLNRNLPLLYDIIVGFK